MKQKRLLLTLGVLIVILVGILVAYCVVSQSEQGDDTPTLVVELDSIPEYGYVLEDRDSEIYKEIFTELSDILKEEEIDYEAYAKAIGRLYIIDLYTISNKLNKYDVGGVEFIEESARENFILKVEDTLYRYIEDNTYGKRNQELPEVDSIEIVDIEEARIKLGDIEYDGYELSLNWKYRKDLGYDSSCVLTIAKIDDKLYVTKESVSQA